MRLRDQKLLALGQAIFGRTANPDCSFDGICGDEIQLLCQRYGILFWDPLNRKYRWAEGFPLKEEDE